MLSKFNRQSDLKVLADLKSALRVGLVTNGPQSIITLDNRFNQLLFSVITYCEISLSDSHFPEKTRVLILGDAKTKLDKIQGIFKRYGINKDAIDYVRYDEAKNFNFRSLQYSNKYSVVFVGPMPHKCTGIGNYISAISAMEQEDGYPPVVRLGSNELKITSDSLKNGIMQACQNGWLVA